MSLVSEVDRIVVLMEEIQIAKSKLEAHDTGYIYTAISYLEERVNQIKIKLEQKEAGME